MAFCKTSDGVELYYEDWGTGGTPLVLIHGWPLSSAMWEYQVVPLAERGIRPIVYDRRGFGRSSKPYGGYDYGTLAKDLAALISHLDLRDAAIVGFSMGGGEVAEYLARHNGDGRVTKAAFVSSIAPYLLKTPDNPAGADQSVFDSMLDGLRNDRPGFLADFSKKFFGVGLLTSPVSQPMLDSTLQVAMQASPKATLDCVTAFSSTDFRASLPSIRVPTLIIHGDGDQTVPIGPTAYEAARLIEGAELKVYAGAPHGLFYTHREQLNEDLATFVAVRSAARVAA